MLFTKNFWGETLQTFKSLFTKEREYKRLYNTKLLKDIEEFVALEHPADTCEDFVRYMLQGMRPDEISRPYYDYIRGDNWVLADIVETGAIVAALGNEMYFANSKDELIRTLYSRTQEGDQPLIKIKTS